MYILFIHSNEELQQKGTHDLQKEVLSSLFNYHEYSEEPPRRIVNHVNTNSRYGHVVTEPPEDSMKEYKIDMDFSRNVEGTSIHFPGKSDSQSWLSF